MTLPESPLVFRGRVSFRSSKSGAGPPGERTILELNPQRRAKVLEITGWGRLEAGTLNLDVDRPAFDQLLTRSPAFVEPGETVVYPDPYKHIPMMRKAYLYYFAVAHVKDAKQNVLVRRAQVPGPIRVELYAADNLKAFFALNEGDIVEVDIPGRT
jgi:hypothetical protein